MAVQGVTTTLGNIIDPATGNQIGVVPGSVADVGTGGTTLPGLPSLPSLPQIGQAVQQAGATAAAAVKKAAQAITGGASSASSPVATWFGIDLEDVVFVVLGIILIAAAAFSFKPVQDATRRVTETATKAAATLAE